ncbi:MAG: FAD:protein FMN transferase [Lachnoclostridium sp.]|nr:FAD:protein FMN transferase [Lachnospira sp.]MCM1247643.1 FAD:protein FMN transferase [Lachnoclostridium sp.]
MTKFFYRLFFICFVLFLTGCGRTSPRHYTDTDTAMGTVIIQQIYAKEDFTDEVLTCIRRLETESLSKRVEGSEIFDINGEAGKEAEIPLTPEMEEVLSRCLEISENSEGAFDITIGEVVGLWDIDSWAGMSTDNPDSSFRLPAQTELSETLALAGYEKLTLENHGIRVPEGMALDLGAVGKGIALDEILALLQEREVMGAVISVGGSILTYGEKPDKSPWKIAIADPENQGGSIGVLTLTGQCCVSTSGDYERYVEADGVRYHHLIDPATGYPAQSGIRSVTILTKNGFLSDALSTACFVLGEEKGMELAERYGVEALFVREDGSISMTEGMQSYFSLSKPEK